jgi:hypothetical protein
MTMGLFCQNSSSQMDSTSLDLQSLFIIDSNNYTDLKLQNHIIIYNQQEKDLYKNRIIPVFMVVAGLGIAGMWSIDIASGRFSEQGNFFKWREGENMLWPHIFAEYLTSAALITGGIGLYNSKEWALNVSFCALGALTYTAINSSSWVLAEKNRLGYGIPMWASLTGSIISITFLLK